MHSGMDTIRMLPWSVWERHAVEHERNQDNGHGCCEDGNCDVGMDSVEARCSRAWTQSDCGHGCFGTWVQARTACQRVADEHGCKHHVGMHVVGTGCSRACEHGCCENGMQWSLDRTRLCAWTWFTWDAIEHACHQDVGIIDAVMGNSGCMGLMPMGSRSGTVPNRPSMPPSSPQSREQAMRRLGLTPGQANPLQATPNVPRACASRFSTEAAT